jgi:predicted nucleic acid-binding protein
VNDIWIAGAALDSGAHLITFDEDFTRVPGLPHTFSETERTEDR